MSSCRKTVQSIPTERLYALETGTVASTHLTENLAINFSRLMQAIQPDMPASQLDQLEQAAAQGITRRMLLAANLAFKTFGEAIILPWQQHPSDTVRGWACFLIALLPDEPLATKLERIRPLADDSHFGVREWAWLALRPAISAKIETSIALLTPWTLDSSANIRRFSTESTRPRGVWCAHINALKKEPWLGLPLLTPLAQDPSPYVQDSVGNWLNDAAKSQPDWVKKTCAVWEKRGSQATDYICRRALRSLTKKV